MNHKIKDLRLMVNIHRTYKIEDKVKEDKNRDYKHRIISISIKININNNKSTWCNSLVNLYISYYTNYNQKLTLN